MPKTRTDFLSSTKSAAIKSDIKKQTSNLVKHVDIEVLDGTVKISGIASNFYVKQVAIHIVKSYFKDGTNIDDAIKVVYSTDSSVK